MELEIKDHLEVDYCEMACQVLDYNALDPSDLVHSKSIMLEGMFASYPMLLLVDSGDSHNSIVRESASSLGLQVKATKEFLC